MSTRESYQDVKPFVSSLIAGIIMIVVGYAATNMSYGMSLYIISEVNRSMGNTLRGLLTPSHIQIIGTAIMIAGVTLVVTAVAFMLKVFYRIPSEIGERGAGA